MPNLIFMIFLWRLVGILDFFYKLQKETHRMLLEILEIHIKQDFSAQRKIQEFTGIIVVRNRILKEQLVIQILNFLEPEPVCIIIN